MSIQEGTTIADFVRKRIAELNGKISTAEIAHSLGYKHGRAILMFERGEVKIPLDKIPALAVVLRADPSLLMTLGLAQYLPSSICCMVTVIPDANALPTADNEPLQGLV